MGRVLANNVSIAVTEETSLGTVDASADWLQLEPNSLGALGASISTIVRNPISKSRQRKKGTITDLDSSAEFEHDLIYDVVARLMRGFMFAKGQREESQSVRVSAVAADGELTVPPFATAVLGEAFYTGALVWQYGFSNPNNNGMRVSIADPALMGTGIELNAYAGVAQAGRTTGVGYVSACGVRHNVDTVVTIAAGLMTVTSAGLGTALEEKGAVPGMLCHIGSISEAGEDIRNGFAVAVGAAADAEAINYGYARIRVIEAGVVVFDKIDASLGALASFTRNVDYVFGDLIKSVELDDERYLEQSYQFEVTHPNLGDGDQNPGDDSYIYSKGNFCNTIGINLPLTEKATISYNFIGTDTAIPTVERNEKAAGVDITPEDMVRTEAMNTTADIARLRIENVDFTGLSTDFKSVTFNINNNVSPEKVLAKLGARFMNTGEFGVSLETQILFTNPLVLSAIRENRTVSMDFILKNNDGVIGFDIPAMTLGGGGRDYPENESVLVNLTCETFEDELFTSSVGFSLIPVPLP